jgi:predicted ArsR family transcriptional regulator
VPSRRYDLAGRLLVRAVATARRTARPLVSTLAELATAEGRAVGSESSPERGRGAAARRLRKALESCGYEPEKNGRDLVLHNCPFHQLAEEDRDLVCNMNVAFVQGVCDGTGSRGDARLDPLPGGCCVRVVKP